MEFSGNVWVDFPLDRANPYTKICQDRRLGAGPGAAASPPLGIFYILVYLGYISIYLYIYFCFWLFIYFWHIFGGGGGTTSPSAKTSLSATTSLFATTSPLAASKLIHLISND